MRFVVLLWILGKSTFTSFAGLASLPEIRHELVEQRHWLTDEQIDQAIVITRTTPGPVGVWVVSAGYMADGWRGALAGWIAMSAPSLLVILLVGYFGRRAQHPRVRGMLQCVVLASAVLLVLAAIPIGHNALTGPLTIGIAVVALPLLIAKRVNTLWIVAGAAAVSFTASMLGIVAMHAPIDKRTLHSRSSVQSRPSTGASSSGGSSPIRSRPTSTKPRAGPRS